MGGQATTQQVGELGFVLGLKLKNNNSQSCQQACC